MSTWPSHNWSRRVSRPAFAGLLDLHKAPDPFVMAAQIVNHYHCVGIDDRFQNKRGPRPLGECSTDYGRCRRHSAREPKRIAFPFEPRSENRGAHGILKAVPHVRSTFIFDVHVELARV